MPRTGSVVVSHTGCLKVQVLDLSFNLFTITSDVIDILCHMVQHVRDEYRLRGAFNYGGKMQGAGPWVRSQFREAQYDNEVSDGLRYTGLFTIELFFFDRSPHLCKQSCMFFSIPAFQLSRLKKKLPEHLLQWFPNCGTHWWYANKPSFLFFFTQKYIHSYRFYRTGPLNT